MLLSQTGDLVQSLETGTEVFDFCARFFLRRPVPFEICVRHAFAMRLSWGQ